MLHNLLHLAPGTMDGTWYQVQWHSLRMVAKNESHKLRIKGPDFHSTSVMRHLSSVNQLKTSGAENSNQTAGKCAKSGDWNAQVCCPHSQTKLSMCSLCSCNVVHELGLHLAMFIDITWNSHDMKVANLNYETTCFVSVKCKKLCLCPCFLSNWKEATTIL